MTSVVAWRAREIFSFEGGPTSVQLGDVWVAADSRVTGPGPAAAPRVLTDAAAKILPIPVRMFEGYEHGPGYHSIYEGQLGFAYAGSTFSATMTQTLVASCLSSLCGEYGANLPSLEDLVDFICRVGTRYTLDVESIFEACVVGAQPDRRGLTDTQCFHLTYSTEHRALIKTEIDLDPAGSFVLLGSRKAEISKMIAAGFETSIEYSPTRALTEIIAQEGIADIGGGLQIGRASRGGFRLFPTWGYNRDAPNLRSLLNQGGAGLLRIGAFHVGDP